MLSPRSKNKKLSYKNQESAKGAGGKGARVINCHNFFSTPDTVTGKQEEQTTQQRKAQQNEKCDNLRPRPPLRRPPFGPSEKIGNKHLLELLALLASNSWKHPAFPDDV